MNQSQLLYEGLRDAGVKVSLHIVEGAGHGFSGPDVDRRVDEFFDLHLKGGRPSR
jgi:dipeptidyl aminopeptidase/acylaminoacyl peptidase